MIVAAAVALTTRKTQPVATTTVLCAGHLWTQSQVLRLKQALPANLKIARPAPTKVTTSALSRVSQAITLPIMSRLPKVACWIPSLSSTNSMH